MDKIHIRDLALRCILGVNPVERREKQDVLINICLHTSTRKAGRTDHFKDAVDYRALKRRIVAFVEGSRYFLVEALAESLAGMCLDDRRVSRADVLVEKPAALRFARTVGVEISRRRAR